MTLSAAAPHHSPLWSSHWTIERDGVRVEAVAFLADGVSRVGHGDACLVNNERGLLAIADGVSTLPNGGPTARRCLKEFNIELAAGAAIEAADMRRAVGNVNRRIFAARIAKRSEEPLGACVLLAAALSPTGDALTYCHVGDGVLLARRDAAAEFETVTRPQVVRRSARLDPSRKLERLAAAVGARPTIDPELGECELGPGGAFILASDGVSDLDAISRAPWFAGVGPVGALEAHVREHAAAASDDLTLIAARRS